MTTLVEMQGVSHSYNPGQRNEFLALRDVNLTLEEGQVTSLVGESGSGKTTLLMIAALLMKPQKGRLLLGGESSGGLDAAELAKIRARYYGIINQRGGLVAQWTALENVMYLAWQTGHRIKKGAAKELLESLRLKPQAFNAMPASLSGGEYQRVAIAVALAKQPYVILADEPTSALDSASTAIVMEQLIKQKPQHAALLIVSHNMQLVWGTADKIYTMSDGRISVPSIRQTA